MPNKSEEMKRIEEELTSARQKIEVLEKKKGLLSSLGNMKTPKGTESAQAAFARLNDEIDDRVGAIERLKEELEVATVEHTISDDYLEGPDAGDVSKAS